MSRAVGTLAIDVNAKIRYHSIQIHQCIHLEASYINEFKYCSRIGGFFYIFEKPELPIKPNDPPPKLNSSVLVNRKIINTTMSPAQ